MTLQPILVALMMETALPAGHAPLPAAAPIDDHGLAGVDELAALAAISDEELANYRGGFTWQGVQIGLGAEIRTFLNGELVLRTNISWTPAGAQTTQFVSGALTEAGAAQLQVGILTSGGITMRVGDQSVFLANGGQTAILHRTDGAIQNVMVNRANQVEALQEIDATLDLQNFGQFQQQNLDVRLGNELGDMIGAMAIGSLNN